jgi:hypothetical protein
VREGRESKKESVKEGRAIERERERSESGREGIECERGGER